MNAARFALPPLPQPTYSFRDVPRAKYPDLEGSTVEYVTEREDFQRCMAEMLLVCKEAVRRQKAKNPDAKGPDGSKPLSLEYLADRLDVDEPLWGFLIRHNGRLQGFVTVTTFTNYQKTFRWDSCNEAAFAHDDEEAQKLRQTGVRKVDQDGSLARQMQATVRAGDIWGEGVVWPRIAEISLLGGLGCGRILMELVIEELERLKASSKINYDFVALQATNNSVSFYESLGFVRVGAVSQEESKGEQARQQVGTISPSQKPSTPVKSDSNDSVPSTPARQLLALPDNVVMSKFKAYEVKKAGEPLNVIAKKFKTDVYDVIFLNQMNYPNLVPGSRLIKGTVLRIPDPSKESLRSTRTHVSVGAQDLKWFTAKENDTPRSIAKMFGLNCLDLVQANKNRLKGLLSNSRLKQGTKVRISHLDAPDTQYSPYAHWAFPDDEEFEDGEPSYMMAMPLNRLKGIAAKTRPIREGLKCLVGEYTLPEMVHNVTSLPGGERWSVPKQILNALPPPRTAFDLFVEQYHSINPKLTEKSTKEKESILRNVWKKLPTQQKSQFVDKAETINRQEKIKLGLDPEHTSSEEEETQARPRIIPGQAEAQENLFNMVVRLKSGVADSVDADLQEFKYWYVLTFIPDLRWAHLAPMVQDGFFGEDKRSAKGRPRWKLVDEKLGKELDISSSLCIPCKSRAVKRTVDADKEEWDIQDNGKPFLKLKRKTSLSSDTVSSRQQSVYSDSDSIESRQDSKQNTLKRKSLGSGNVLWARYPNSAEDIRVKLTGKSAPAPRKIPKQPISRKRKQLRDTTLDVHAGGRNSRMKIRGVEEATLSGSENGEGQKSSGESTSSANTLKYRKETSQRSSEDNSLSQKKLSILSTLTENTTHSAVASVVPAEMPCYF